MTRSLVLSAIAFCAALLHVASATSPLAYAPRDHPLFNPKYYNPYYRPAPQVRYPPGYYYPPSPSPSPSASSSASAKPTPSASTTPTPSASVTPTPSLSVTPTPSPSTTPTPSISVSPTPTSSPTPTPSNSPKPHKPEKKCLVYTPGIPTSILNVQCLCPGVQSHAIQIRPETPTLGGCMERCYESDELIQKACDDAYDLPGGGPPRYFTFNDAVLKGGQKRCCEDVCGGKFRITRPGTRFCDQVPYHPTY